MDFNPKEDRTMYKLILVLGIIFSCIGCGIDEATPYPWIYDFEELEKGTSRYFSVSNNDVFEVLSNPRSEFFEDNVSSLSFEMLGLPFDKITFISESEVTLRIAAFTGEEQDTTLTYQRNNLNELIIPLSGIELAFSVDGFQSESMSMCLQATSFTEQFGGDIEYAPVAIEPCAIESSNELQLAESIKVENDLVPGDSIFIHLFHLSYSLQ